MNLLDLLTSSILGALGCDMTTFIHYFPAADTMYTIFIGMGMGILLLNFVWQLFRNFGLGMGIDAEDPLKLTMRTLIFMLCVIYAAPIVNIALEIGGKPYDWILSSSLPPLQFASFLSAITPIIGGLVNGSVVLIGLILLIVVAWNYLKLLLEAAERYILLGVIVYTAPIAFSLGGAQSTNSIFKNWCRMLGGQMFLLMMNAWCLKLFTTMVGTFLADPMGVGGNLFVWMLCAVGFLKVSQKIDSFMGSLGISVGRTGGSMVDDAIVAARGLSAAKKIGLAGGGGGGGKLGGSGSSGGSAGGTSSGAAPSTGFMQGGLVGAVGRKVSGAAASNLTSSPGGERGGVFSGIASQMYNNSIGKEGGFASKAIGSVATGSIGRNGMITGDKAGEALQAYMGGGIASSASQEDGMQPTVNAAPEGGMENNIPMNPDEAGGVGAGVPGGPDGAATMQGDNGESAIAAISGEATQDGHTPIPTGMDGQDAAGGMDGATPEGMTGAAIPEGMDGAAVPAGADVSVSGGEAEASDSGASAGAGGPASGGSVGTVQGGDGLAGSYMGGGGGTSYRDVTMGGGRITGTEVNGQHPGGIQFAMYNTDQYGKPDGAHSVVKSLDGAQWYKQYAQAAVERTPISEKDGKVEYNEKIVQKLPKAPQRLDRM